MNYRPVEGALVAEQTVGSGLLSFVGEQIRAERTGIHARITIHYGALRLAYDTLNVDKDADRVRLANSAHKFLKLQLNGQHALYPAEYLKKDLDNFCFGLWEASLQTSPLQVERMGGTAEPVPVRFVLRPYVIHQGGTILFAHPGKGKSYLAGLMAVSIDAGLARRDGAIADRHEVFDVETRQPVLFINLERGKDQVQNRLGSINAVLGLPRERPMDFLNARGKSLADVEKLVRAYLKQEGPRIGFLDSISRAGMGDLNENQPANRIMDLMNDLFETWVAIAHAPKGSDEHVFGAMHFEGAADVVVRVHGQQAEAENATLGIGLEVPKGNDVGRRARRVLALEWDGDYGLKEVRAAKEGEFPEAEGKPTTYLAEQYGPRTSTKQDLLRLWMGDGKQATAKEAALAIGAPRQNVSAWFQGPDYYVSHKGTNNEKWYRLVPPGFEKGVEPNGQ